MPGHGTPGAEVRDGGAGPPAAVRSEGPSADAPRAASAAELGVVQCPKCHRVRGIYLAVKNSKCPACHTTKPLAALKLLATAATPEEMQRLVATWQAKVQGAGAAVEEAALAADIAEKKRALKARAAASEGRTERAAAAARSEPAGARRWKRLLEALSESGPFTTQETARAADEAGLKAEEAEAMLARFQGEAHLVELPGGRWMWVGD